MNHPGRSSFRYSLYLVLFLSASLSLQADPPAGYGDALSLYQAGQYDRSLEKVRGIFEGNKNSYELRMLAAANYIRKGEADQAIAHIQYCIQDHPDRFEPHLLLARVYRSQRRYYPAIQETKTGLSIKPDVTDLRIEMARSYYGLRRYFEARQQLDAVLKQNANHFDAIYLEGLIYLRQGRYDLAEFRLRNALSMAAKSGSEMLPALYNNLGFALEKLGDSLRDKGDVAGSKAKYADASQMYESALRIKKDDPRTIANRNRLAGKTG